MCVRYLPRLLTFGFEHLYIGSDCQELHTLLELYVQCFVQQIVQTPYLYKKRTNF